MPQVCYYSPAERQMEKERRRASDDAELRRGEVSRQGLSERNGFFSSLQIVDSSLVLQEAFA